MTENKLEGFEDFGDILPDADSEADAGEDLGEALDAGGGGEEGGLQDDLEEMFTGGDVDSGGEEMPGGEPGADSELESFFEDLSTIDDLEVLPSDEEAAEASADEDSDIEVGAPDAEVAAEAEEPPPKKEKKVKKKTGPGFIRRNFRRLIILAILGGGGWYLYDSYQDENSMPWQVYKEGEQMLWGIYDDYFKKGKMPVPEKAPPKEPERMVQLPRVEERPPPVMKKPPRPPVRPARKPAPARESGPWSIQVASCFFPSCLDGYRSYLRANKRSVLIQKKSSRNRSLEIYSVSSFTGQEDAREIAVRINRNHPMEGHAYSYRENGSYRISMGAFEDLARAKVVKDALNRQFAGEIVFATRTKTFPYQVQTVMTGRYPSRRAANEALAKLKNEDPRFKDAFVVRRR